MLNWSITGLKRLLENGRFTNSKSTMEMQDILEELEDPVVCFINNCLVENIEATIPKDDMYRFYRAYCRKKGFSIKSKTEFSKKLKGDQGRNG